MERDVKITLVENSTAGSPPKVFAAQIVEIAHEPNTVVQGVDGKISTARHPSIILWIGGTAKHFTGITDVKIVGRDGEVLIDGELCTTFEVPRDVNKGVMFFVLRPF